MQSAPEIKAIIPVINFCFDEVPLLRSLFGRIDPSMPSRFKRFMRSLKNKRPEFAESSLLVLLITISFEFKISLLFLYC